MSDAVAADAPVAGVTLRQRVMRAGSWALVGHVVSQVIKLGSNLVLTRLLAPDAFGLMSVVYLLAIGLTLFSDLGVSRSVIQSTRGNDPAFLDTAWTLQVTRGIGLGLTTLVLALGIAAVAHMGWAPVGTVYADERLPWVVAAFSVVAVISGLESIRLDQVKRQMQLHWVTQIELSSQISAALLMLLLAWWTRSIWSLVAGSVMAGAVRCTMSYWRLPGHRERWRRDADAVKELLSNAKWTLMSSILTFCAVNGDRLMLGGMIDSRSFGLYSIAFLLVNTMQVVATMLTMNVAYPAFSEVHRERPHDLGRSLARFQWAYDGLICTGAAALLVAGPSVVALLYDARYQDAGWMLSILALSAIGWRAQLVEQCFQAVGRPEYITLANLLRLLALVAGIWVGRQMGGVPGAIVGIALSPFATWPLTWWFRRQQGLLSWQSERVLPLALLGGAGLGWVASRLLNSLAAWHHHFPH
jgi:O-antigen/teichoic acid export membrane protein